MKIDEILHPAMSLAKGALVILKTKPHLAQWVLLNVAAIAAFSVIGYMISNYVSG